jgi:uncharacterized membrane protein YeaQ/YmgE (transglycosylase-associated protein family)
MFGFILWIIVGGVAGYVAERVMKEDHPIWINVALGVAGSFLGNVIFSVVLGLSGGNLIAQFIFGVVGACALIWGYREYEKRRPS